jgi:hypothetical protein
VNLISCNKSTVRGRKNQYEILICRAGEADRTDEVLKGFVEEDRRHRKMSCNKNTKGNKKTPKTTPQERPYPIFVASEQRFAA